MTRKILALCLSLLVATPLSAIGALDVDMANICAYGGISPSYFGPTKTFVITPPNAAPHQVKFRNFHDHFRFPFIFGGSAGYSFTECLEINLSCDYITARGDTHVIKNPMNQYEITTGTFGSLGAYLGAKYFVDLGSCWYPFFQLRGGVQLRRATRATILINSVNVLDRASLFHKNTLVPAGGVGIGFDGPLTEYVNIFVMGEVNVSGQIKSQRGGPLEFRASHFRTMPIVAGLRFRAD